jgi:hypothetical protein
MKHLYQSASIGNLHCGVLLWYILQISSSEVVKLVHEVGQENHVGDVNQSYLKRKPQTLVSGHRPRWITLGSSACSCSRTPDVLRRHFWQRCRMFWILPSYFQYLFLRDSEKRSSLSTALRKESRTETDFLRHYSYVALNFGFHFSLFSVFNDQQYSDSPLR